MLAHLICLNTWRRQQDIWTAAPTLQSMLGTLRFPHQLHWKHKVLLSGGDYRRPFWFVTQNDLYRHMLASGLLAGSRLAWCYFFSTDSCRRPSYLKRDHANESSQRWSLSLPVSSIHSRAELNYRGHPRRLRNRPGTSKISVKSSQMWRFGVKCV